ncbi:hypothetical protein B4100_0225 [Heyndrickxia coagulans]|nr:hypothetical protein B4100_0225 [Heyndrickxia coagulans]
MHDGGFTGKRAAIFRSYMVKPAAYDAGTNLPDGATPFQKPAA